jgi:hypothetical protein
MRFCVFVMPKTFLYLRQFLNRVRYRAVSLKRCWLRALTNLPVWRDESRALLCVKFFFSFFALFSWSLVASMSSGQALRPVEGQRLIFSHPLSLVEGSK